MLRRADQISKSVHIIKTCTNTKGCNRTGIDLERVLHKVKSTSLQENCARTTVQPYIKALAAVQSKFNEVCRTIEKETPLKINHLQQTLKVAHRATSLKRTLLSLQTKLPFLENGGASESHKNPLLLSSVAVAGATTTAQITEPIPEPPPAVPFEEFVDVTEVVSQLNALGEPTFVSLGLGGKSPAGLVQHCFEYLHVTLDLPWWGAIAIGTLVIRVVLFPLVVIAQRNAAKMNNCMPQLQALQVKMTEARQLGNQLEAARYTQELALFMKEKQLNPLKNMLVPLAQMPVFLSFFIALREMANLPLDSLRTGGLWWFTDLTVPDQFYLMPLITSITLLATIELGADTGRMTSTTAVTMRYVLRALPVVIFPFIINFPGAILCYWVSSNFISLLQVGVLRIPAVREYFKIEPLIRFDPQKLPIKPKNFTENIKDSWTNIKISKELEERKRLDEMLFQRAGKGPMVKTYKHDPTKVGSSSGGSSAPAAQMSAKKR